MATTHSGYIRVQVQGKQVIADGTLKGFNSLEILEDLRLPSGTSDGQIDLCYIETTSSIAASTTTVRDLAGSLTDVEGNTLTFAEVAAIAIRNRRTTALATLLIGPDATNGFGALASGRGFWNDASDRNVIHPDSGWMVIYAPDGVPVSAGSTDELAIITSAVSGDDNAWDLVVLGRSA